MKGTLVARPRTTKSGPAREATSKDLAASTEREQRAAAAVEIKHTGRPVSTRQVISGMELTVAGNVCAGEPPAATTEQREVGIAPCIGVARGGLGKEGAIENANEEHNAVETRRGQGEGNERANEGGR